ncbi:MAG: T9SS type A sorting domain-containing protein [Calditrichaeota bacterium]|nr:T9SS type A sorting domain-containing protein [Calditrichota bacterium]
MRRIGGTALLVWVCLCGASFAQRMPHQIQKPETPPTFRVPEANTRTLDEPWVYAATLYDVSLFMLDSLGALPVGFAATHDGRAFLATLHTVFRTLDGGRVWSNLDPLPPPGSSPSYEAFRRPNYISSIHARPVFREAPVYDTLFISAYSTEQFDGAVRLLRGFGVSHVVSSDSYFVAPRWLTSFATPDSNTALSLAGFDAEIYRSDSVLLNRNWDTLDYHFGGTWVSEVATSGDVVLAVGSHQWRSEDRGETWEVRSSADFLGDTDISFAPSGAVAAACGGRDTPASGWLRISNDLGESWSLRKLTTEIPLRTVLMVNDTLGYTAGGVAAGAIGEVWKTTDGGETWSLDLSVDAEITELGVVRESNAYVNIIAAGYFADFRGGVWRSHLYMPDTSAGVVLVATPDTIRLQAPVGGTDAAQFQVSNQGTANVLVSDVTTSGPFFNDCCEFAVLLEANESMTVTVTFQPQVDSTFQVPLRVINDAGELLEVIAIGETSVAARDDAPALPETLALSVYPNPGNAEFRLSYSLTHASDIQLALFDVTGRNVATVTRGRQDAGTHTLSWNASEQASGVYFAVLQSGELRRVQKLVLMK